MKKLPKLDTDPLFPEFAEAPRSQPRRYKRLQHPIWTKHKAKFIQQYLKYFVQVTHHGVYIDGFAGPQNFGQEDSWAAALVLNSEPKWLRQIWLCELTKRGFQSLKKLKLAQPHELRDRRGRIVRRSIEILRGDFNVNVEKILDGRKITPKETTFCLLDQRTFECHWDTVKKLAAYKLPPENKIELLYFLGVGWLHRAFSGIRNFEKMNSWWGSKDWGELLSKSSLEIAELVRKRFETELGYRCSAAYPVFDSERGNKVMYYMIHASDHEEAPALMVRAHHNAVRALQKETQLDLFH